MNLPGSSLLRNLPSVDRLPGHAWLSGRVSAVAKLPSRVSSALPEPGRRRRRAAAHDGLAHIEVRGAEDAGVARAVEDALVATDGVEWAVVDPTSHRAVVRYDDQTLHHQELVPVVEALEHDLGAAGIRFAHDLVEHPLDGSSEQAAVIALVADGVGLVLSITGAALRVWRVPIEIGGLVTTLGEQPRVRRLLADHLGPTATEVTLSAATVIGLTFAHGPFGLTVDALQRVNLATAARATASVWRAQQHDWLPGPDAVDRDPAALTDRPALPRHAIETFADRAAIASAVSAAAAFVANSNPRRIGAMFLAGAPKPARLGRELWAGQIERILARRGVVVLDRDALRRLDQVDTVVLDARTVVTGRWRPDRIVVAPGIRPSKVHKRLRALFDADDPMALREEGRWAVGPTSRLDAQLAGDAADWAPSEDESDELLGVRRDDRIVAVFVAAPSLRDGVHLLADSLREEGVHVVLAGGDGAFADRLHVDDARPHLTALEVVRARQATGSVVAALSHDRRAVAAADIGLAIRPAQRGSETVFPSGATALVPDVDAARFVLEAGVIAREVVRQSNAISLGGAAMASILALTAPVHRAGVRASRTVNAASVFAMANGVRAAVQLDRHPAPPQHDDDPRWHELPRSEVLDALDSSKHGLSSDEAARRLPPREAPLPRPLRFAHAVVSEMANPLTPVLAGSALLAASVGSSVDAVIVLSVVGLNGLISGTQRYAAEQAIHTMAGAGRVQAHVRRDGQVTVVDASQLVRGDVVLLDAGDTVPADCRVLRAQSLDVDEASLTGESEPVRKQTPATFASLLAERSSMLFAGTAVVSGRGEGVVVAVGRDTEASSVGNGRHDGNALGGAGGVEARLDELGRISLPAAAGAGVAVTAAQLLWGTSLRRALPAGVSMAVAAVPEGLPMLATVGQLATAHRLSRREVLVRNPRAIEALGRAEVLCLDKTGTLTEGRIELRAVSDLVDVRDLSEHGSLGDAHRMGLAVACRATPAPNGERRMPHFTDRAVADGAETYGVTETDGAPDWQRAVELPFGNDRPYHATWGQAGDEVVISVKGAPEVLTERCSSVRRDGKTLALDGEQRSAVDEHVRTIARRGMRVLALAERRAKGSAPEHVDEVSDDDVVDLELIGLLALADPLRRTSIEAVQGLRDAGVDLVMVTGDHPSTAEGIAVELGIMNGHRVLTGAELDAMGDVELDAAIEHASVIARVTPAHKARIVRAFQRSGRAVAMSGDGANDANAMRLADAGIAVGHRASPSARDAADVIIADDRIETIVEAIIEGRSLWSSVRDGLALLLGGNLGELTFMLTATAIGGRPPLSTRQVLIVNLMTDVAPALAIVARPATSRSPSELAAEGPDRSLGGQLGKAVAIRAAATALGATAAWSVGRVTGRPVRASTMGLTALVGTQLAQTIAVRYRDPVVIASALGSAALLLAMVETPGVSQFLGCTPLGPVALSTVGATAVGSTLAAVWAPGAIDWLAARLPHPQHDG